MTTTDSTTEITTTATTSARRTDDAIVRINPSHWNSAFHFDQAQLRPAPRHILDIAGQGALDVDGTVLHPDDTAAQLGVAMDNIADLLRRAGMDFRHVTRMVLYVTDMDAALAGYASVTDRLGVFGATPPATLVQVSRLALPGMVVEIEATAGR